MKALLVSLLALAASACSILPETISGNTAGLDITNPVIVQDLVDAKFNADEAVRIGIFDASDPAPYCLADVLKKIGAGSTAESFKPKYSGVASAGMVGYIEKRKLEKMKAAATVDVSCKALIGQIVIDAAGAARRAVTPSIMGLIK